MTTLKLACALVEQRTYSRSITKEQIISEILRNANLIRPGISHQLLQLDLALITVKRTSLTSTMMQVSFEVPDTLHRQYMALFPEEFI